MILISLVRSSPPLTFYVIDWPGTSDGSEKQFATHGSHSDLAWQQRWPVLPHNYWLLPPLPGESWWNISSGLTVAMVTSVCSMHKKWSVVTMKAFVQEDGILQTASIIVFRTEWMPVSKKPVLCHAVPTCSFVSYKMHGWLSSLGEGVARGTVSSGCDRIKTQW